MSAIAPLVAVLHRSQGERLVLSSGERPYLLVGGRRVDVGSTTLSPVAVEAAVAQMLTADDYRRLAAERVEHVIETDVEWRIVGAAERHQEHMVLEVRRERIGETDTTAVAASIGGPDQTRATVSNRHDAALDALIARAALRQASAVYLRAGHVPMARVRERLEMLDETPIDPAVIERIGLIDATWTVVASGERQRDVAGVGQVTCHLFADHEGVGATIILPSPEIGAERIRVPAAFRRICATEDGLVVVCAAGTRQRHAALAAAARLVCRERGGYVISLESTGQDLADLPAPFVSRRVLTGRSAVAQAIRRAAAEHPDVLIVDGVQERDEVVASIQAATGARLVVASLAAASTATAIEQLQHMSEGHESDFQTAFRGAWALRYVRATGGGELRVTDVVSAVPIGAGGVDADRALARAVRHGRISLRAAARQAADARRLLAVIRETRRRSSTPMPA